MAFEINGSEPPAGARPVGLGYKFILPESTGFNGNGEPVGALGKPRLEIRFEKLNQAGWDWWEALTGTSLSATLTSVQFWNPYKSGGVDFDTWTGGAVIHRPTYESIQFGQFQGVEILITEMEES